MSTNETRLYRIMPDFRLEQYPRFAAKMVYIQETPLLQFDGRLQLVHNKATWCRRLRKYIGENYQDVRLHNIADLSSGHELSDCTSLASLMLVFGPYAYSFWPTNLGESVGAAMKQLYASS